ncbi:unnamed protein product, partial [Ranitomeya imitator]
MHFVTNLPAGRFGGRTVHAPAILQDDGAQGEDGRTDTGRPGNYKRGGKEILSFDDEVRTTDSRYSLDTGKALQGRVDLSISDMSVSDVGVYTCSVLYSPDRKNKDITVDVKERDNPSLTCQIEETYKPCMLIWENMQIFSSERKKTRILARPIGSNNPKSAALELSAPTTYLATMGSDNVIPCEYTIEKPPVDPGFFAVFWFFQGKEILSFDDEVRTTDSRYSLDTGKALQGRVDLSISDMSVSDVGVYTCSVLYSPDRKNKDITVDVKGAALELSAPTTYLATMGSDNVIPCEYTIEKPPVDPGFFAVFWFFQGKEILSFDDEVRTTDSRYSLDTGKALQGRVDLSISDMSVSDVGVYTCSVLYSPDRKNKDITVDVKGKEILSFDDEVRTTDSRYSLDTEKALQGRVDLSISDMSVSDVGVYTCSVLYSPDRKNKDITVDVKDIEIKWFRGSERLSDVTEDPPLRNLDGTYSVNSTVTIPPTEKDREQNVSCRVQHESLKQPLQEDFQLGYTDNSATSGNRNLMIIIPVVLGLLLLIIIVIVLIIYFKRKKQSTSMREFHSESNKDFVPVQACTQGLLLQTEIDHNPNTENTEGTRDISSDSNGGTSMREFHSESNKDFVPVQACTQGLLLQTEIDHNPNTENTEGTRDISSDSNGGIPAELRIGDIIVPGLILNSRAQLECPIYNYKLGEHTVEWYGKKQDAEELIPIDDQRRLQIVDQNDNDAWIAYLTLTPVKREDDKMKYICKVKGSRQTVEASASTKELSVTEQKSLLNNEKEKSPKSPEKNPSQKTPDNHMEAWDPRWIKTLDKERNPPALKNPGKEGFQSVNESSPIKEIESPQIFSETATQQETKQLRNSYGHKITQRPENGKGQELCPGNELPGEEEMEEHSLSTNKTGNEKKMRPLEESCTNKEKEGVNQENENQGTSHLITDFHSLKKDLIQKKPLMSGGRPKNREEQLGDGDNGETSQLIQPEGAELKEISTEWRPENSEEGSPGDGDNEETSLLNNS